MKIENTGIYVRIMCGIELVPEEFLIFKLPSDPEAKERTSLLFSELDHDVFIKFCTDMSKVSDFSFFAVVAKALTGKKQ